MIEINIQQIKTKLGWEFKVRLVEGEEKAEYQVTMGQDFYQSLKTEISPAKVVEESFRFLLEREPKESILPQFDIKVISHYFPEYKEELLERIKK